MHGAYGKTNKKRSLRAEMWQELHLLNPVYTGADKLDQFRFQGNYPPIPPLSHHFALSEK